MNFKILFLFPIISLSFIKVNSQTIEIISKGANKAPSIYDIIKINENEFWAGGEFGLLYKIDSNGVTKSLNIVDKNTNILKLHLLGNDVIISLNNGEIVKYNLITEKAETLSILFLKGKCIYDMIEISNHELLVCGGSQKVAQGKFGIPNGFMALIDLKNTSNSKILYKNKLSFGWAISSNHDSIFSSVYKAASLKTQIYFYNPESKEWNKSFKIKALVHDLYAFNDQLWYSGSKNLLFKRHGAYGKISNPKTRYITQKSGCIFSLSNFDSHLVGTNYWGNMTEMKGSNYKTHSLLNNYPIYESIELTPTKLCIVGHGNLILILNKGIGQPIQIDTEIKTVKGKQINN